MTSPDPSSCGHVLVVDDDAVLLAGLAQWLGLSGFTVTAVPSAAAAREALRHTLPDAVLTDLRMPGEDGMALLAALRTSHPGLPVVLLTGHGDVPQAVAALKQGAFDFLEKPHDPDRLTATLRNACTQHRLTRRVQDLTASSAADPLAARLADTLCGQSAAMVRLRAAVKSLLPLPLDVLLRGETGTGKEVAARALHDFGPRADRPFIAINCAALPAELIESELFGHESGAFTGAREARTGKFEAANGGTVFLDEIESMPLPAQAKLLRVLQDRTVERIGGNRRVTLDLRIISAAKDDLRAAADAGRFRDDLYYRLAGFELDLPPLRDRGDDILLLFTRFAAAAAARAGLPAPPPPDTATIAALLAHRWPGNVRELRAQAERYGLGLGLGLNTGPEPDTAAGLDALMDQHERRLITAALDRSGGSVAGAMEILRLPRRTLNEKMRRLGIDRKGGAGG